MQLKYIPLLRLQNQQISHQKLESPAQLVSWMGAMQSQDFAMVKWAVGLRLPKSTENEIDKALDNGEILRTHLLRPTWHLVSHKDIHWMLALSAPQIRRVTKGYNKRLGLTPKVLNQSKRVMEKAFAHHGSLGREELKKALEAVKIDTGENRLSHILMDAELEGLICSGKTEGRKPTFALLEERVPTKNILTREESLAKLAEKYFQSHGPAQLQDYVWWSGLSTTDARKGLEAIQSKLRSEEIEGKTFWLKADTELEVKNQSLYLLPAFDEYFIAYKDRSAIVLQELHARAASSNGIFWPIIVQNGKVTGTWKRLVKGKKVSVETDFFESTSEAAIKRVNSQIKAFGKFLGKEIH